MEYIHIYRERVLLRSGVEIEVALYREAERNRYFIRTSFRLTVVRNLVTISPNHRTFIGRATTLQSRSAQEIERLVARKILGDVSRIRTFIREMLKKKYGNRTFRITIPAYASYIKALNVSMDTISETVHEIAGRVTRMILRDLAKLAKTPAKPVLPETATR